MTALCEVVWPILDHTFTRAELIDEAEDTIHQLAAQAGCQLHGPTQWATLPAHLVDGWRHWAPGAVLIAVTGALVNQHRLHLGAREEGAAA